MMVTIENSYANFFWTKYTSKDVYAYLLRLHYKTFNRLKYYSHAFTEYYNRNVQKCSHQSSNVGIINGTFSPPLKPVGQSAKNRLLIQVPKFQTAIARVVSCVSCRT